MSERPLKRLRRMRDGEADEPLTIVISDGDDADDEDGSPAKITFSDDEEEPNEEDAREEEKHYKLRLDEEKVDAFVKQRASKRLEKAEANVKKYQAETKANRAVVAERFRKIAEDNNVPLDQLAANLFLMLVTSGGARRKNTLRRSQGISAELWGSLIDLRNNKDGMKDLKSSVEEELFWIEERDTAIKAK